MSYVILRKWCSKYIMDILLKEKKNDDEEEICIYIKTNMQK